MAQSPLAANHLGRICAPRYRAQGHVPKTGFTRSTSGRATHRMLDSQRFQSFGPSPRGRGRSETWPETRIGFVGPPVRLPLPCFSPNGSRNVNAVRVVGQVRSVSLGPFGCDHAAARRPNPTNFVGSNPALSATGS